MAFNHGKNSYFAVEDSGGSTLRNLSTFINDLSITRNGETVDTTTFGAAYKTFINGFTDWEISISGFFDPTATTGPDAVLSGLLGANGTFGMELGPAGNTNGYVKYSGEVILTKYELSSSVDGACEFSADFQGVAALSRGTFS